MILKRIYDETLAQASYLIGCASTGEALIVDPNRDIAVYERAAAREGVRITHVTETHIHADFVSGARELAEREGAKLYLSATGGTEWQYTYAGEAGAVLLKGGDRFDVGQIRLDVLHTPGHTPEHLSFLVTDCARAAEPIGILTGDFVFVGDVGRPDLLERAARQAGTMEGAARSLFESLKRFKDLPDYVQVWPGHGQGSACGKSMSAMPFTTVGYEKRFNSAVAETDVEAFVASILVGQPEPPTYFAEMKRINREGPRPVGELYAPEKLPDSALPKLLDSGALVVDTRPANRYASAHVPGTLSIPLNKSFATWAGWLIPYDRDFYLIMDGDGSGIDSAVAALNRIGLDAARGYFTDMALSSWSQERGALESVEQITVEQLEERLRKGEVSVLDVRGRAEWEAGHLPGVENVPVGLLTENLDKLPESGPLVVHCQGGGRSAIAASLLRASGRKDVMNLTGGYSQWVAGGRPTERGE